MDGFTIIDAVVAGVIILSAILAYARGFVREVMAIAGWVAAAVVAYVFTPQAEPLVKQIPYLQKYLAGSCELSIVASFAVVFALALVVFAFFTPLLSSAVRHSFLSGIDASLGLLFGVARGILLVAVAFIVYDRAMSDEAIPMVTNSKSAQIFAEFQKKINANIPTDIPKWVEDSYQHLVGNCGAPAQAPSATPPGNGAAAGTAKGG